MLSWLRRRPAPPRRARPALQRLEGREVPATFTVLNAANAGPGSLRQAVLDANSLAGADAIDFDPTFFGTPRTITLAGAAGLSVTDDLTVAGPGAANLTVSGNNAVQPFRISNANSVLTVTISGLTVAHGRAVGTYGGGIYTDNETVRLDRIVVRNCTATVVGTAFGGGIAVGTGGNVTVIDSTVTGNTAITSSLVTWGGGIVVRAGGNLTVTNSTVSGNTALRGGGIGFYAGGILLLENSTVADNTASDGPGAFGNGGGIAFDGGNFGGVFTVRNSTITGNVAAETRTNAGFGGGGISLTRSNSVPVTIVSSVVSGNTAPGNGRDDIAAVPTVNLNYSAVGVAEGFTLSPASGGNLPFGTALGLLPLADNLGPTETVAFAPDSPLIDAGSNPANLAADQRGPGFTRVEGPTADIGAFELQGPAPQVAGVAVNAGQANTTQRSRITSIQVTFSTRVTFAGSVESALTLSRIGGGAVDNFTATANVVGGVTVVTLYGFNGAETEFGSLADGRYVVTVAANQVRGGGLQLDGNGDGTAGDDYTLAGSVANGLFRLFGDVNGDGVTNAFDFGQFRPAFGSSTGQAAYLAFLDIDGNGVINAFDFARFRTRFGSSVP